MSCLFILKLKGEKMDNLKSLTQKENIILSDIALEKFEIYRKLILEWNEKINLTAITDEEAMNTKHFLDCLLLTKTGLFNDDKSILDVGTGAGFPAIPLKLYNENLKVTMLDSLNKRIKFLNIVIEDLNLYSEFKSCRFPIFTFGIYNSVFKSKWTISCNERPFIS